LEPKTFVTISILVLTALSVSGCAAMQRVIGFKDQAAQAEGTARIEGRIDTEGPAEGTLVVVLGHASDTPGAEGTGADTFVRVRPGTYAFPVAPGRYQVGAYEDRNRNGLLDLDERAMQLQGSPVLEVGPGEVASRDLVLKVGVVLEGLEEPLDVLGLVERSAKEQRSFSLWAWSVQGEICEDLADDSYGPDAGPRGLWQIMDFLNDGVAGIYFMEPYDPGRIPVLFVHGISGYPQEFSTLIDSLDRDRFQPWFYFYPSGFGLDGLANHLATLLERLQVRHDFDELAVVAHSMGGLVSRGAILKYQEETGRDDVRLFVSISTPWGGDVNAKNAEDAPIQLPDSFKDMNPSSDYLRWVFYQDEERQVLRHLPEDVDYHMIFGFRMNSSKDVADDGTVTVASQTRPEARDQALTRWPLDSGHVEILHSEDAVSRLSLLLDQRF
jgi:pimeloyl-ACP methyl ester carboxylesterase